MVKKGRLILQCLFGRPVLISSPYLIAGSRCYRRYAKGWKMFTGHFRSYLSTGRTYITKTSLPRYCLRIYTQTAIDISALIVNQIQLCQICQISRATLRSCALGNNEYAQETYIKRLDGSQSLTNSRSHTTYFVIYINT